MFTSASTTTLHTGQMLLVYSTNTSSRSRLAIPTRHSRPLAIRTRHDYPITRHGPRTGECQQPNTSGKAWRVSTLTIHPRYAPGRAAMRTTRNDRRRIGDMMRAVWNGAVLAETPRTVRLEGNHYFPPE